MEVDFLSESTPREIGNYQIISKLGSGSFASVWLAQHKLTGLQVAIKIVQKSSLDTSDSLMRFNRECALLKQIEHPFIAELFEIIDDADAFYLVMEYVEHGNMLNYVNSNGRLSEDRARHYFCQLISALDYLHNEKFVAHRDLKAENVLLDVYDNIRLIDFGLSNAFSKKTPELKTACGSPAYAAPEMIQGQTYTKAADIWSAGILLYAMVVGRLPFDDPNVQTLLTKVVTEEVRYPSILSYSLIDLLKRLLTKNPEHRITLTRIKEHPWFSKSEYQTLTDFKYLNCRNSISSPNPISLSPSSFTIPPSLTPAAPANSFSPQMPTMVLNQSRPFVQKAIDSQIISQMAAFGLDVGNLSASLMAGEFNGLTAIYREIKKSKITEQMKDLMEMISNQGAGASFPYIYYSSNGIQQPFPTSMQMQQPSHQASNPTKYQFPQYQQQMGMLRPPSVNMEEIVQPNPYMQSPMVGVAGPPPMNYIPLMQYTTTNRRMSRPTILKRMPPGHRRSSAICL